MRTSSKLLILAIAIFITPFAFGVERWWSGAGADEHWDNTANWWGTTVPTSSDVAYIDVAGDTTLIDSSQTAVCNALHVGEWSWNCYLNITGGSLTISNEMDISTLSFGTGYGQGIVNMSGGTVNVGTNLMVCLEGWWALLEMTGGTINVNGTLWVPGGTTDGTGDVFGELHLYGGVINAGNFDSNDLCGGRLVDIVLGQLIINGNDTADISAGVTAGWIVAYDGAVPVEYDYNITNSGKTTVKAAGCHWTDATANDNWNTAGNWIGGIPTSSDFAGITAAGTVCEIGSGIAAQCNKCMIAYFAGSTVEVDVLGGTLTTPTLIVGGTDYATGILDISSGTVDVTSAFDIGDAGSVVNITSGTLKITGDQTADIYDNVELGKITAYDGNGVILFDYNVTNSGKTTVLGGMPTNQHWDNGDPANSLWSDADNWVESSVPTKRDKVTIDIADSNCQITSVVNAVCLGLIVGDDAAGTSYLDMTGGTLKVGQNAVPSNVIIACQSTAAGVLNISSGTVDIEASLVVANNGTGTLNVSGGILNIEKVLIIAAGTGSGTVNLSGGTINAGNDIINAGIEIKDIGTGRLDIKGGTLVLNGDATARIIEYAASGKIVAYGGRGTLNYNYNVTNSGKTTVTATSNTAVSYNPSPAGGSTFISTNPTLTWSAGSGATSHDVYLGTRYNDVYAATTSSTGIYKGNQATTTYSPATLDEGAEYYWRIDEVSGSTAKGNIWKFQVECPNDLRTTIKFNDNWLYYRGAITSDAANASSYNDSAWESVCLPHNWRNTPLDVAPWVYSKEDINWYRKYFKIPSVYSGQKVFIEFEGVDNKSWVWVNGTLISSHHGTAHSGAFLPFTVDITDYVNFGSTVNVLAVKADNSYSSVIPEFGRDSYGGLWRNVNMHISDKLYVTDAVDANVVAGGGVFVSYSSVSSSSANVNIKTHVQNDYSVSKTCSVKSIIIDANNDVVTSATSSSQAISAAGSYTFSQSLTVSNPELWHPDSPYLYTLITEVYDSSTHVDSYSTRIGIKTIDFSDTSGFSINGSRLIWIGTNRIQNYPWVGTAMSDFQQKLDARRMKDAGWHLVRAAHCPMSDSFMDTCDELGLMVEDSIPGFHYYADGTFANNSYRDMRDMIRRDRNHASPVLWELQINEGEYTTTYASNAVAVGHAEIPQDPCSVCGWLWDANDVFDVFICAAQHGARDYSGTSPLVISEHGHWDYGGDASTSDASRLDGEAAMLQQAWNHQDSHNLNRARTDLCGDNVWAFNDRGVSSGTVDMFRLPKFSYYFWQSQRDPDLTLADSNSGPMVYIANYWTANSPTDVRVYSNCDQVRLYINNVSQGTQTPDSNTSTANLLHPPFTFEGLTFASGELKAEGLIGGVVKATYIVNTPGSPSALDVSFDTLGYDLTANDEDMVFINVSVVDTAGTMIPSATNEVTLTVTGPAKLVSPATATADAGIATFMIRTLTEAGTITATATASGLTSANASVSTLPQNKTSWIETVNISVPAPGQATNPSPANSATNVSTSADLSWTAGSNANSHDVYFGTTSPGTFQGNQAGTTFDTGTMSAGTTYYWRIDEVGTGGTTTGTVWSFTTVTNPPTYIAAGSITSGTGTITPALPSGIATNDILLLFVETSNQAVSISNSNGGTWTEITNSPQGCGTAAGTTGARLTAFWSRYNGSQGVPTVSDSGDHQQARMIAIRGAVSSGNPWNVTAGGVEATSDTSGSIPGATTTVANTLVVTAIATSLPDSSSTTRFSAWTNANLTSLTERTDNSVTAGNGGGLGIATGIKATAGAYGNTAVTLATSAYKGMMSIAIKP
jgi:hypothetical protein